MDKKKIVSTIMIVAIVIVVVIAWIMLPEMVVVQFKFNGDPNRLPKIVAIIIPTILAGAGIFVNYRSFEEKNKGYLIYGVGLAIMIAMIVINRLYF